MVLNTLQSPQHLSADQASRSMQVHAMQSKADLPAAISGAASGDSSAFAAPFDAFYRTGSSTRSSFDSEEHQSQRSVAPGTHSLEDSPTSPHSFHSPTPTVTTPYSSAAAAASAVVAAFSAFSTGSAVRLAPVQPIQLTIQPLDMTHSASQQAPSGGACAQDDSRNLSWQAATTAMTLAKFQLDSCKLSGPAVSISDGAHYSSNLSTSAPCPINSLSSALLHVASLAACNSDDRQSRPVPTTGSVPPVLADRALPNRQQRSFPQETETDQSCQTSRAAITSANRHSAMIRFHAKREQRTFDKKVRYASRKRLAEARPRVRGQFVKAEVAAAFLAEQSERSGTAASTGADAIPMDIPAAL